MWLRGRVQCPTQAVLELYHLGDRWRRLAVVADGGQSSLVFRLALGLQVPCEKVFEFWFRGSKSLLRKYGTEV